METACCGVGISEFVDERRALISFDKVIGPRVFCRFCKWAGYQSSYAAGGRSIILLLEHCYIAAPHLTYHYKIIEDKVVNLFFYII